MGRRQREALIAELQAHPEEIPADRFVWNHRGRIECVLCGREGYRGHVGAPPPPETYRRGNWEGLVRWSEWYPWAPWQLACLGEHPWVCACGLRFPAWSNLRRHIGRDRHPARVIRGHYQVAGLPTHVAVASALDGIDPTGMRDLRRAIGREPGERPSEG